MLIFSFGNYWGRLLQQCLNEIRLSNGFMVTNGFFSHLVSMCMLSNVFFPVEKKKPQKPHFLIGWCALKNLDIYVNFVPQKHMYAIK